ncbi:subunit CCDC53 of endosome WASH complex [Nitzschia inconspicua]|uniref:Subunit CCDC53 of endosome WASH complex n=1 Tax=Nitzschia inconspicua TaxID=303405 RepID=A0A9K3LFQ8_9STRA|nr:subunit CCDC53 of endosome WASH complex [Nitzschia inconspicua]
MPDLLEICPHGAWVFEDQAVQILGLASRSNLKEAFTSGYLPHVYVEHGERHSNVPEPYNSRRFFFIQKEGTTCNGPSISLSSWVTLCQSLENGATQSEILHEYTNISNPEDAQQALRSAHGIVTSSELADLPPDEEDGAYRYGSNGGRVLAPSKASSFRESSQVDGEIYTRADGKKVRRIKKTPSASGASLTGEGPAKKTLSGFLNKSESGLAKSSGSQSVAGGEGEVYVRADGKKVRRVKKSSISSVVSEDASTKKSLSGFLENSDKPKLKIGGAASVAGDQIAISKESSLTGEVYVRADGKKVRRVKKSSSGASVTGDDSSEIMTRPDGTKVRRIRKPKQPESPSSSPVQESTTSESASPSSKGGLSGFLGKSSPSPRSKFSGSHSVGGDQHLEGEIYVRADGKKVRRVRKVKSSISSSSGASLSGFLDSEATLKPKQIGAATVVGDIGRNVDPVEKPETEIYVRPDGTKVRRIRKTAVKPVEESAEKKTLSGFLSKNEPTTPRKLGGSASVAGDQIAVSKEFSLTGEVYVRADGKKVRRVKKLDTSGDSGTGGAAVGSSDNVEIITRPDGTRVRRIRKTKPISPDDSGVLSGFLDSQPRSIPKGGGATVAGDRIVSSEMKDGKENGVPPSPSKMKESLDGFLGKMDVIPRKIGGSASVAGDQIAVGKDSSLTGEVYVRSDGKTVRRVKKPVSQAQPGDEVEIITRPDGTKVRRIRRAKKTEGSDPGVSQNGSLGNFLGAGGASKSGSSATVAGDYAEGEIYIRADGKKVRRVRKNAASSVISEDQYEIYVRPDGTKVRRIKRNALSTQKAVEHNQTGSGMERSLSSMLSRDEAASARASSAATVAGDDITGKSSLRTNMDFTALPMPSTEPSQASNLSSADEDVAQRYRKMLKMGMPEGAVMQKMSGDCVPQHIQDSVLAGPSETSLAPLPIPINPPAPPVTTGANILALSSQDEEIAMQYRKMLKMGMPEGAVVQKMAIDGVEQKIQDSVIAGEAPAPKEVVQSSTMTQSLSAEEEEIARHYRKMLKMGMPEGAVIQKMSVDGVEQKIQDSVIAGEAPAPKEVVKNSITIPSLSAEEEEIAKHYRKMLKMGMPEGAVTQKMSVDGIAQHIQDSVIAGEEPAAAPVAASAQKFSSLSAEEEQLAAQYRKMLKMGMPEGAVTQKMSIDGVAQNVQDSVIARENPTPAPVPEGMALVQKDAAMVLDGMVLVPKEQAERTIPDNMVAVPREKAGDGIPEGYVLVPKDQVKGDPGDDLILVRKDQVKDPTFIVLMGPDESLRKDNGNDDNKDVDISTANIVSMDNLADQVEKLKKSDGKGQPRFLLQALPEDADLEEDFLRKNLLPNTPKSAPAPAPAPKPAAPSTSVAEILAQMSSMGGDFDAERMGELLQKLEAAEKRQAKLEKQLAAAGVAIAEDIDYDICVKKVEEIGKRMNEIGGSDVTHPDKDEQNRLREEYFKLEQEMEKYNNALLLTDEYQAEQERIERKWEEDNAPGNLEALKKLRRHMPIEVRNMSEAQLTTEPTPNGKYLPKETAKKFKRTNVLQLIRRAPDDIVRMHPSTLENMRVTGLTLTERRALYEHLRGVGPQWNAMKAEKMTERKWTWYNMMKNNFKENLASWQRHVDQYGPPGAHPYATRANPNEGCPLIGKQCPLKADKLIDYDGDYGYGSDAEYEVSEVRKADTDDPGAKAMQEALELMKEKKANERSDALKKHYQGKLLQVSKANGSCEQMDEMMDKIEYGMMKWLDDIINMGDDKSKLTDDVKKKEVANFTDVLNDCKLSILDICGRSGMQLSGKKTDDEKPDPRSIVECSLSEEAREAFDVFAKFVTNRLKQTEIADTRIKSTIDMLQNLLKELHERNLKTIAALGGSRLDRSRKLKTQEDMMNEIKEKQKAAEPPPAAPEAPTGPPLPGPPRGGLMDAIKGGRGRGGGGRGGLLDAIKSGRGGGDAGGRGGLLAAIQGRGGGGGGGADAGGRGGLLAAIQGRGRGGGRGGGDPGGRGGLLAAIQARGGGDD